MKKQKLFAFLYRENNNSFFNEVNEKFGTNLQCGYANGYVAVPKAHPFYKKHYDDLCDTIFVHGGLTFSEILSDLEDFLPEYTECINFNDTEEIPKNYWVFGFDTMHFGDNKTNRNRDYCIKETKHLLEQLEKLYD